jgi:hypothetical protein
MVFNPQLLQMQNPLLQQRLQDDRVQREHERADMAMQLGCAMPGLPTPFSFGCPELLPKFNCRSPLIIVDCVRCCAVACALLWRA